MRYIPQAPRQDVPPELLTLPAPQGPQAREHDGPARGARLDGRDQRDAPPRRPEVPLPAAKPAKASEENERPSADERGEEKSCTSRPGVSRFSPNPLASSTVELAARGPSASSREPPRASSRRADSTSRGSSSSRGARRISASYASATTSSRPPGAPAS